MYKCVFKWGIWHQHGVWLFPPCSNIIRFSSIPSVLLCFEHVSTAGRLAFFFLHLNILSFQEVNLDLDEIDSSIHIFWTVPHRDPCWGLEEKRAFILHIHI